MKKILMVLLSFMILTLAGVALADNYRYEFRKLGGLNKGQQRYRVFCTQTDAKGNLVERRTVIIVVAANASDDDKVAAADKAWDAVNNTKPAPVPTPEVLEYHD